MAKRLESGRFTWPGIQDGVIRLTAAQFGALLEGLDWRFYWDEIEFDAAADGAPTYRLRIHTLSLDEGWIGV